MKITKIEKVALLNIVRENLVRHLVDYAEAVSDFKIAVIKISHENLAVATSEDEKDCDIKNIKPMPVIPANYTAEYNRAIRKLELSVDTVIDVDELTFNQLVLDEWNWKSQFLLSNAFYKTLH